MTMTRPIFGKIRYMNYAGCKRKFDLNKFVQRMNGQKAAAKREMERKAAEKAAKK
jgi:deoxyribodipyrimidine photo-lyase